MHNVTVTYTVPVSYTHLDVYKRQIPAWASGIIYNFIMRSQFLKRIILENVGEKSYRSIFYSRIIRTLVVQMYNYDTLSGKVFLL